MGSYLPPKRRRLFVEPEQAGEIRRRIEQRVRSKAERRAMARRRVEDLEDQRLLARDLFDVFDADTGASGARH